MLVYSQPAVYCKADYYCSHQIRIVNQAKFSRDARGTPSEHHAVFPQTEIDRDAFGGYIQRLGHLKQIHTENADECEMEPNIWKESFHIRSYEVDCRGRLSILSIFNFMQEAASKHADALGVSVQQLLAEDHTWLLSRLKLKMDRYPAWTDQLAVQTWPSGTRSLFAMRDFHLSDQNGRSVGSAVSAWLVIDTQKRRPVRIAPFVERLKPVAGDHILSVKLNKLPLHKDYEHQRHFRVRRRDLDINQHVNNASYVEWVLESIPVAIQDKAVLSELEINFLAESFFGNRIIARCQPQDPDSSLFHHSLLREEDGRELLRARTVWQPISKASMPQTHSTHAAI